MEKVVQLYRRYYDKAVLRALYVYEGWILPDMKNGGFTSTSRQSLYQTKLKEFRERKKLLNPYSREQMIEGAS